MDRAGRFDLQNDAHLKPKVRFPASGGANDFGSLCWRMMEMTNQDTAGLWEKSTM
ncbi:MAG: hypothetical protein ACR2PH_17075 [Desulfobulbia bacterium]